MRPRSADSLKKDLPPSRQATKVAKERGDEEVNGHQSMDHFQRLLQCQSFGTPAWIRTKDQLIKSQLLYQLSYRGMGVADWLGGQCR